MILTIGSWSADSHAMIDPHNEKASERIKRLGTLFLKESVGDFRGKSHNG